MRRNSFIIIGVLLLGWALFGVQTAWAHSDPHPTSPFESQKGKSLTHCQLNLHSHIQNKPCPHKHIPKFPRSSQIAQDCGGNSTGALSTSLQSGKIFHLMTFDTGSSTSVRSMSPLPHSGFTDTLFDHSLDPPPRSI